MGNIRREQRRVTNSSRGAIFHQSTSPDVPGPVHEFSGAETSQPSLSTSVSDHQCQDQVSRLTLPAMVSSRQICGPTKLTMINEYHPVVPSAVPGVTPNEDREQIWMVQDYGNPWEPAAQCLIQRRSKSSGEGGRNGKKAIKKLYLIVILILKSFVIV